MIGALLAYVTALMSLGCTFAAADPPAPGVGCPNQGFRVGPSASLPDCRAYELVTPADSNGRIVSASFAGQPINLFPTELGSTLGASLLYFTQGSPLSVPSGSNGTYDQYEAVRGAAGWETARRVSPSGSQAELPNVGGVSPDHLFAFTNFTAIGSSGPLSEGEEGNLLISPDGSLDLIGVGSLGVEPLAEGTMITPVPTKIIFATGGPRCGRGCHAGQLEPQAPPTGTAAIYERTPAAGSTEVVSLLPGNVTPVAGEKSEYLGASADGAAIVFQIGETMYVRLDSQTTREVVAGGATFAGISTDGSKIFYELEGDIYRFDVSTMETHRLTSVGNIEVVNVSADGSHVYFLSTSQLDGESGSLGEPNLYVWAEGVGLSFIATVSSADLAGIPALNNWTTEVFHAPFGQEAGPGANSSRSNPSGSVLVFASKAQLTGYPNEGFTEIYRYDATNERLACVSCGPIGTSATGEARLQPNQSGFPLRIVVHNVSNDGERVFFETEQALLPEDVDGVNDIYEWDAAGAAGSQLSLISSGRSTAYLSGFGAPSNLNQLVAVSPSGNDVFFQTSDALVRSAGVGGVPAIYDARVGGGFAEPTAVVCAGESCHRLPSAPPALAVPGSAAVSGRGNQAPPPPRCTRTGKKKHRKPHKQKGHRSGAKAKKRARAAATVKKRPTCHRQGGKK